MSENESSTKCDYCPGTDGKHYMSCDRPNGDERITISNSKLKDVERWLDRQELDRLEMDRLMDDLLPGGEEKVSHGKVHKSTDKIQEFMSDQRQGKA